MAKGRSKDPGKGKPESKTSADQARPAKVPSGVRKQIRRLERQLADAARKELKRVRKLERAHHRRQMAQAALDALVATTPKGSGSPDKAASAPAPGSATAKSPAAKSPAAKSPSVKTPAPKTRAAAPRTTRATATTRRAAPKTPPTGSGGGAAEKPQA